jgi:hypothetical protein
MPGVRRAAACRKYQSLRTCSTLMLHALTLLYSAPTPKQMVPMPY